MELMNREGILRPRELPYAKVTLKVVEETKDLTKHMIMDMSMILSYTEMAMRECGLNVASIVGKRRTAERVKAILDIYKAMYRNEKHEDLS